MSYQGVLKADTEIKVVVGPVVAVGDGFTPVATLDVSTADEAEILKHNAAAVTDISGNTFAAIASADGYYNLTVTAAQLDTEGMLTVLINDDSLCLPVRASFMVVNANVYDSLYAAATTDYLQTDVTQWLGTAAATPTVAGVPEVDVTHWLGTAVTANVAGQPTVDVTRIGASTQSLIDLKDFADSCYDPTNNKVQSDLIYIHGSALTETAGQLAAGFIKLFDVATPLLVASDVMRGTDSAALAATALTDATWTDARAGYLDELAAANLPTDIADIPTVAEFEARSIAAADYVVVGDTLAAVTTVTNLTNAPTNGDLTATMKTSVNTEVADVIKTDTISEMAQGVPSATPTLEDAIMYLYMYFRNEVTQTATTLSLKNDGGTVITKATVSDDATTFTKGEMVSGP